MPSFDIVSEIDHHEVSNAVDQANREVTNRFDFKGSGARYELAEDKITLHAQNDFQLKQMLDILQMRLAKRGVDVDCLDTGEPQTSGQAAHQEITLRQGIDRDLAKQITKRIKETKLKVQAAVQGDQVRVTGKKRDDLQQVMQMLREAKLDLPLQFTNFRD
ncbi:YajQ family cyclic di-GMP-binding protein [Methylohalobius crimeensis]|uniref:YajQ family cyclic di-GMP-binding protein n=1 Tax=Methylohalobius crimeensis TaxID=244365 RepID=UPI0003B57044|nr:YajQ family cyclic di-GMP-binding protein [Methylohalobius crimeensis]